MTTPRAKMVQSVIDGGNVADLLALTEWGPCSCLGPRDGEPLCHCRMNDKQVRDAVSYFALLRGKLVRLKAPRQDEPQS